ncbi:phosphatase PAP2 family protein [Streptomyces sp. TRM70350]|uniref:phosphatase PAP2 family protein n=1 Tax=Streptomyces sp. TRM70350 TaxID=2856165 RepID=UPI001C47316C|nr:phosphatase PAP2 family protein [Streptomyces sp. TRM70350]MBV7696350.1 phosphatase PAP2 family protein [Streptomyces sp. TRM70350]
MHTPSVESPPRPSDHHTALRAGIALASISVLLLVLVAAEWGPVIVLDREVSWTTHRWAVEESGLTQVCRILTDWVWDPVTMRILCAVAVLWLVWRRSAWWTAAWLVVAVAASTGVQQTVKAAVGRERPDWPDPVDSAHYAAFPSGHAMTATVVLGLLLWLLHHHGAGRALFRTALTVAVVSVVGVGLTRVWLGVHWPTDVVAGWSLGAMMVALAVTAHRRLRP